MAWWLPISINATNSPLDYNSVLRMESSKIVCNFSVVLVPEWSEDHGIPYLQGGSFEEGVRMPLEMHAVHYKKEYLTLKVAKRFDDGILILVYFMELKSNHNPVLHRLLSNLQYIQTADTKTVIEPFTIDQLIKPFTSDYYTYYGSIATAIPTPVTWLITRKVTTISPEQLRSFHQLQKPNDVTLYANSRKANPFTDQIIFHVNPPYPFTNSTLSPIPILCKKQYE